MTLLYHTVLYNLVMAAVDLAVFFLVGRRKNVAIWCGGVACAGMVALILAVGLGEGRFGVCRLAAYGLFLHGVVVLVGSAVVWWRTSRLMAGGLAVIAALLLGVAWDAFLVEPTWLEVSYHRVTSEKLDRPIRIVLLADLQTDQIGDYERTVLRRVMQQQPDLILLAGDYLQAAGQQRMKLRGELNSFLHHINFTAPQGVFAVGGNIDPADWPEIFKGLEVTAVHGIECFELDGLRLTCLGLHNSYTPTLKIPSSAPAPKILNNRRDQFHVVVGHSPNFALGQIEADLLLAGHTHGGQVRLPVIGPLVTLSRVPRSWAAGMTHLSGGRKLLVSRGVGMERAGAPRIRFLCRPELVVVDLVPAGEYNQQ